MKATALKILLVSREQSMLVALSKFLDLLGLVVREVSDPRQAIAAAASERPDLLILDGDLLAHGGRELCRTVCGGGMANHVFTLLMIDEKAGLEDLVEALKLGIDDFLTKPIVFGELLSRLRAAARGLEYERRVQAYLGTDPLLGLPNANAFRQTLRAALDEPDRAGSVACVTLDLDFFDRLNYTHGRPEAEEALRTVAKLLAKNCRGTDLAAACGDDRFWILLPDRTEDEAGAWAEHFRLTLAETPVALGVVEETITASLGVAAGERGTIKADDLLHRAEEALHTAKRSGRNCVVLRTSLDDESNAWTNLGAPGKLFDRTVARDVMTACTATVRPDDSVVHAASVLQRTGQAAAAVVDREGKLIGLATAEDLAACGDASSRVDEVMKADPVRFAEHTSFADLVSFFSQYERSLAVIVDGHRPTGIVTRNALAALSEPLSLDSFAPQGEYQPTSDYLVVRDGCQTP